MLSDSEIEALIEDVKPLSSKVLKEIQLKNKENRAYKNWKDALMKMLKECNFKGDMSLFNSFN